jgi:hypothetical protein
MAAAADTPNIAFFISSFFSDPLIAELLWLLTVSHFVMLVDDWFMPAVGALVRCTDGSWMTRPPSERRSVPFPASLGCPRGQVLLVCVCAATTVPWRCLPLG